MARLVNSIVPLEEWESTPVALSLPGLLGVCRLVGRLSGGNQILGETIKLDSARQNLRVQRSGRGHHFRPSGQPGRQRGGTGKCQRCQQSHHHPFTNHPRLRPTDVMVRAELGSAKE